MTEQNKELQHHINALEERLGEVGCNGKKLGELGSKQRSRRLKELKSRAQVALWFMKSYGLELTCLKGVDQKHGKTSTIDLDELYHELMIICDELPKSYFIKQKRNQLNDICTIESVPGHYPGAQISFTETLKTHIEDLQKNDPSFGINEPVKVKISGDGVLRVRCFDE